MTTPMEDIMTSILLEIRTLNIRLETLNERLFNIDEHLYIIRHKMEK